jgi:hypothetical protein
MIRKTLLSATALAFAIGATACERNDDTTVIQQDTVGATFPTQDTVQRPVIVPGQDTVAVERTVEVEHDTIIDTRP